MKEIFDPNLQILHSPIFRRALPVRCGMAGANDASLFPANQKGARVLPFSAAGGMPSAMLAFPKGKTFCNRRHFFSAKSICAVSPHSLHVARQPHSTGAEG